MTAPFVFAYAKQTTFSIMLKKKEIKAQEWNNMESNKLKLGWTPDILDTRDHSLKTITIDHFLLQVDLREPTLEIHNMDRCIGDKTCSFAILSMIDWQARKWLGTPIDASPEFLHYLTVRIFGGGGLQGVSLRACLKTLKRFGSPPSRLWNAAGKSVKELLSQPELYSFASNFIHVEYQRVDDWLAAPKDHVDAIRSLLQSGNVCVIGFAVPLCYQHTEPKVIPLDINRSGTLGGTAGVAVGFDDQLNLPCPFVHPQVTCERMYKGAFLVRTCWGNDESDDGYIWLPYASIECGAASSVWTAMAAN